MQEQTDMKRRMLPIGMQDFRRLRERDCYYVDKTALIGQMVRQGDYYFLSRPRRFGKSLLLDTLRELFAGSEELFRGLHIHERWDWSVRYPVVRVSFGGNYNSATALEQNIHTQLTIAERHFGLEPGAAGTSGPDRFLDLLDRLHAKTGQQVVVLVDEYDKPILDVLEDAEMARANRDYLRGFYGIIKGSAEHVRFVFITGVSMFSNVNLFSGLNNLKNISLDARYSSICGYTDADIDTVFAAELPGLDRDEIRRWYNGYSWLGEERVYNPFDVLLLFDGREFEPYWFRTGAPTFLYRELVASQVSITELESRVASKELVSSFDMDNIGLDALMFQTGYLTIVGQEYSDGVTEYRLGYPNYEVELSLNRGLLRYVGVSLTREEGKSLFGLLGACNFTGFRDELRAWLSGIPYLWHDRSGMSREMSRYESWYASLVYMMCKSWSLDVRVEEASSRGRSDLVLLYAGQVYVMEFKVVEDESGAQAALERAMEQIMEKGYSEKYRGQGQPVHCMAMVFGREKRTLLDMMVDSGEG